MHAMHTMVANCACSNGEDCSEGCVRRLHERVAGIREGHKCQGERGAEGMGDMHTHMHTCVHKCMHARAHIEDRPFSQPHIPETSQVPKQWRLHSTNMALDLVDLYRSFFGGTYVLHPTSCVMPTVQLSHRSTAIPVLWGHAAWPHSLLISWIYGDACAVGPCSMAGVLLISLIYGDACTVD